MKITPNTTIAHHITDNAITLFIDNQQYDIAAGNLNFDKVKAAILERKWEQAVRFCDPTKVIDELGNSNITAKDGIVYYKTDRINDQLQQRLLELLQSGHNDLEAYYKFLENVYNNPSHNSREQLYDFIANRGMPIVGAGPHIGCVIGYKGVSEDFMDKHRGTHSNIIGITNEMDRRDVDDNPNNHCSAGFHIGTKDYADNWAGQSGHLMAVVFNPKDAVAVPAEHGCQKLRVSKYTVIAELFDRKAYLDQPMYKIQENTPVAMDGDGIVTQKNSDNYYKARNYIESARDNGLYYVNKSELDKFNINNDELVDVMSECDAYLDTDDGGQAAIWLQ